MPMPKATERRRQVKFNIPESVIRAVEHQLNEGALGRRRKLGDLSGLVTTLLSRWLSGHEEVTALDLEDL